MIMMGYIFSCCMGLGRNEEETSSQENGSRRFMTPNGVAQKFVFITGTSRFIFVL